MENKITLHAIPYKGWRDDQEGFSLEGYWEIESRKKYKEERKGIVYEGQITNMVAEIFEEKDAVLFAASHEMLEALNMVSQSPSFADLPLPLKMTIENAVRKATSNP